MRKKVYVLLLFCLSFFMVCTTMKAYARAVFPPLEAAEANSFHDEPSFIVPESPFFVFTPDYIIPLSPSAGTVCKVPGVKCVDHVVTERCVIDVTGEGLVLSEIRRGHTVEEIQAAVEPRLIVAPDLKEMEED